MHKCRHYYFGYAISSMVYKFFKANLVLDSCDKCFRILSLYIISRLYPKINSKSLAEKFERGALYIFGEVMTSIYRINDYCFKMTCFVSEYYNKVNTKSKNPRNWLMVIKCPSWKLPIPNHKYLLCCSTHSRNTSFRIANHRSDRRLSLPLQKCRVPRAQTSQQDF